MNKKYREILPRIKQMILVAFVLLVGVILLSSSVVVRAAGGDLDPTFNPGMGTEGGIEPAVWGMALQPDGKIIIGGYFTTYNNVPRSGIARLNPDGSLDTSFQIRSNDVQELTSMALQPDGKIIIGGLFVAPYISTTHYSYIARLNADGSFDTSFDPRAFHALYINSVNAITLQPDGRIIVGGDFGYDFDNPLHLPRPGIMRLNQDGSIDHSFNVDTKNEPKVARVVALQPNGKIIVAGEFLLSSYPGSDKGIARFNADGSLDTTFDPGLGVNFSRNEDRYDEILTITVQPDGKLVVGGIFRSFNGVRRSSIARLNADGSLDSAFDPKGEGARDPYVFVTKLQPDGKIIIGGSFSYYDGTPRKGLARLNQDGSLDTTFDPGEQTLYLGVRAITIQPDGRILIGGLFAFYKGIPRRGIARLLPDGPGAFSFSTTDYSVLESGQRAVVTVNRSGDLSQPATVDYATSDLAGLTPCNVVSGMASARCDYAASVGTLRFAAGESQKTIFILIINDSFVEAPEVFQITLSNPVGAELGIRAATFTILDDDRFVASANPIRDDAFFIRQLYIDFLGRETDAAGLQGWLDILHNTKGQCKIPTDCDRVAVALGFFRSPEFQDRGYFVFRFYATALGRNPSYNEFVSDTATVSGFLNSQNLSDSKEAFVRQFMNRQEFKNRYDSTTNDPAGYVDKLLQTVGLPNHSSKNVWIAGLANNSLTRAQVLRQLVETTEVHTKFYNQAFIVMQYFGYLRRDPDAAYQTWINIFNHSGDYRIITNGFINSPEYPSRFGP